MLRISYLIILGLAICCSYTAQSASSGRAQSALPKKIEIFLDKHFHKYEIKEAQYDSKEGKCKVKYTNGIKVEFDHNADWKAIQSDYVPLPKSIIDLLPHSATDFIAKQYPRKPILKIKHKADQYKVKLEGSIELVFNHQGKLIMIDD